MSFKVPSMNKTYRIRYLFILIFLLPLLFFPINRFSSGAALYENHIEQANLGLVETGQCINNENETNSVNIKLPTDTWNITGVDINFTGIKLGKETKIIEDSGSSFISMTKNTNKGLGVELNITQPTEILGCEIYGYLESEYITDNLTLEIRGINPITGAPNETIYGNLTDLNFTSTPNWHIQAFQKPIQLAQGYYFLVLQAIDQLPNEQGKFHWYNNEISPLYPGLNISRYSGSTWQPGESGKVFRHKLIQKSDTIYNPENINMTVELNNTQYDVLNGSAFNDGFFSVSGLEYHPGVSSFSLFVNNTASLDLIFNTTTTVYMRNVFEFQSNVTIPPGSAPNQWILEKTIVKYTLNYTIILRKPNSWSDLNFFNNGSNITSQVDILGNEFLIYNNSIINETTVRIEASSPKVSPILYLPAPTVEPLQELKFSAEVPSAGTLRCEIYDALDFEDYAETRDVLPGNTTFSHQIIEKPRQGDGQIHLIWHNNTDAGLTVGTYTILIPFTIDPVIIIVMGSAIGAGAIGLFVTNREVKKRKVLKEMQRKAVVDQCMDLIGLRMLIVIDKKSGVNVYEQTFSGENPNPTLISGFIEAIRSFGLELSMSKKSSQTIKLMFKDANILMSEFKNFRILFVMSQDPSEGFLEMVTRLSYDIDDEYGEKFAKFRGETNQFGGIDGLVRKNFNTTFIEPLKINGVEELNLKNREKEIYEKAKEMLEQKGVTVFYAYQLQPDSACDYETTEAIISLIEKGAFLPA